MKFFSDFSSCYRPTPPPQPGEQVSGVQEAFVGGDRRTCSKRNKTNGSKYWKPALSVISEDGGVLFLENDQRKVQSEKKVSCKSRSTSTTANKARTSHYYDDFDFYSRKRSTPVIIPAFSPTPFLF